MLQWKERVAAPTAMSAHWLPVVLSISLGDGFSMNAAHAAATETKPPSSMQKETEQEAVKRDRVPGQKRRSSDTDLLTRALAVGDASPADQPWVCASMPTRQGAFMPPFMPPWTKSWPKSGLLVQLSEQAIGRGQLPCVHLEPRRATIPEESLATSSWMQ